MMLHFEWRDNSEVLGEEESMSESRRKGKRRSQFYLNIEPPAEIVVKEVKIDRQAWRKELHDEM
jgi:hypothetical protein